MLSCQPLQHLRNLASFSFQMTFWTQHAANYLPTRTCRLYQSLPSDTDLMKMWRLRVWTFSTYLASLHSIPFPPPSDVDEGKKVGLFRLHTKFGARHHVDIPFVFTNDLSPEPHGKHSLFFLWYEWEKPFACIFLHRVPVLSGTHRFICLPLVTLPSTPISLWFCQQLLHQPP